jgi:O-acetyl-ADP-ribose deacetylase (regulator of RNase III)
LDGSTISANVEIIKGDILSLSVDAIVNPANEQLIHAGGIAGQIVRKGGYEIQEESSKCAPIKAGDAVITGAGKLPARFVIHAVGPRLGEGDEDEKLHRAITTSLTLANKEHFRSIAIPAISTGIFGFPTRRCAQIMKQAVDDFLSSPTSLERIIVCLYEDHKYRIFLDEFADQGHPR